MNNNSTIYSTLQGTGTQPFPIHWNFTHTVQVTSQPNPNANYREISKEFLEKYITSNMLGVTCMGHFYDTDCLISLHIHQYGINYLYELVGYENFKNKLIELGITLIKYHTIVATPQPVGKKSVIVTFYGLAEVNGKNYQIESSVILQIEQNVIKITNHTLNIFL